MKIPSLRHNKQRQTAFVCVDGRRVTLGRWNSAETAEKYRAFVAEYMKRKANPCVGMTAEGATVAELAAAFLLDKIDYYKKNGKSTRQIERFKTALEFPLLLFSAIPAKEYGPKKLILTRSAMEKSGRFSRSYINTLINCVRSVWRYGVQCELVPAETLHALESVDPLKRGRSTARETEKVKPVLMEDVLKTLDHVSSIVGDMARIQLYSGMRPGEVCAMRFRDLEQTDDGIVYTLEDDKNAWRRRADDRRRVFLGPKAAAVLAPYLLRDCGPEEFVFQPADAVAERDALRAINATTRRRRRGETSKRRLNPCYTPTAYARAIARGAARAGAAHWSPNQLRHLYASQVRALYGLDVAQTMLGHSSADTTQIYAERDFEKARAVAKIIG